MNPPDQSMKEKKKDGVERNEQAGAGPVQDGLSPNRASMFPTEETGQTSG